MKASYEACNAHLSAIAQQREEYKARAEAADATIEAVRVDYVDAATKLASAVVQLAAVRAVLIRWESKADSILADVQSAHHHGAAHEDADVEADAYMRRELRKLVEDTRFLIASRDTSPLAHCTCDGNGPDGTGHLPDCGYWRAKEPT